MVETKTERVYATYVNAGLRGSRFMGWCEIGTADGDVWLTGHRMPKLLSWARALCYVLFAPWIFISIGAVGMTAGRAAGWQYPFAIAVLLFIFIAVVLGGGDIWATYRGPMETVRWRVSDATSPKRTFDSTASMGPLGPTLLARAAAGRCVTSLRAPIGPQGRRRLVALRSSTAECEVVVQLLQGGKTVVGGLV
jgi:hypothetical protein